MTQPQKNTALAAAIVAALLSLPLTWMTIQNAEIQGGFGNMFNYLGGMTINVTGLNGNVTFLFKTPIWFIVCIAIGASVLQLMAGSKSFAIPRFAQWATAIIATTWIGLAVIIAISSDKATLGIGALLGLLSAIIPMVCLFMSTSASETLSSADKTTIGDQ
ncbi:hypothetical protein [uncultured Rubinisphaera sp.]|uniref:hypothetical protein n=1 Tax=uncultured Rubinisphaera sp. TaxID=1678686 RepID=UPI0030D7C530